MFIVQQSRPSGGLLRMDFLCYPELVGRLKNAIVALLLPSVATTACEATTAAMPDAAQQDEARPRLAAGPMGACPFPTEADKNNIDTAIVVIRVYVGSDGAPREVQVVQDPGNGFGRAAALCAMAQRYVPAADRSGAPIDAWTPPVRVRYERRAP
jgi:hypothetical protein